MYRRTALAGVLFAVLYAAAFVLSGFLFFLGVMILSGGGDVAAWFAGVNYGGMEIIIGFPIALLVGVAAIVIGMITIAVSILFISISISAFFNSIGIIRKGMTADAKTYREKRFGTVFFVVCNIFVALCILVVDVYAALTTGEVVGLGASLFVLAVVITGIALIAADLSKNKKDLAKIK